MFQKRFIAGLTIFLILCVVSHHIWAQEIATESAELPTLTATPSPTPSEATPSPTPTEHVTSSPTPTPDPATPSPTGEFTPTPPPPPISQQSETAESLIVPPIYPPGEGCPAGQAPLSTELYLLQALPDGPIQVPVVAGAHYLFRVSGTYTPDPDGNAADAQYFSDDLWHNPGLTHNLYADFGSGLGPVDWGEYTPTHIYEFYHQPIISHIVSFVIRDFAIIDDNYGTLTLNVHECVNLASVPEDDMNSIPTPSPTAPASVPTMTPTQTPASSTTTSTDPTQTPTPQPTSTQAIQSVPAVSASGVALASIPRSLPSPEQTPTPTDMVDLSDKEVNAAAVATAAVLGAKAGMSCTHCQWIAFAAIQAMVLAALAYVTTKVSAERSLLWYGIAGFITSVLVYGVFILYHLSCAVRMWYILWYVSSPDLLCRCFGITTLAIFIFSMIVMRLLSHRTVTVRYPVFIKS